MAKVKEKYQDLVFGNNALTELLKAKKRKISLVYTTKNPPKSWDKLKPLLPAYTQIQYVEKEVLNKIAQTDDHQSVLAYVSPFIFRKKFFDPNQHKFLLMLDGIQDPRNLGAILRTAYCTGVSGVIITSRQSAPITATVLKASAGLAEYLDIFIAPTAKDAVLKLKDAGYNIYISTLDKAENAISIEYKMPLCIVIGNEGYGVSKDILGMGTKIKLPQKSPDISYNASVAAGILLFYVASKNNLI